METSIPLKRKPEDYALYLIIGSLYAFSVNISILGMTILSVPLWSLYMVGLGMLLLFALIFWNRYTALVTLGLVLITAIILFWFREAEAMEGLWYYINEIILLIRGYLAFRVEFNWPIVLGIAFLTALFIAVCLFFDFHFYMLVTFGTSIYIISWAMGYTSSMLGFILFLFCFCVLLVRKLQGTVSDSTRAALIAAPLCAVAVWAASMVPAPTVALDNVTLNRLLNDPWDVVSEVFFLAFNPKYFSFQSTGFGGQGGRLGGPVSPNHRPVMSVEAPRRIYLSGATHNIYTGYGWASDMGEFSLADSYFHPSYIEFMETAQALFRGASRLEITGVMDGQMRFVTDLPLSEADIFVGRSRTGSLFRTMRDRDLQFEDPALHDMLLVNAFGDRRLEELIPRDSAYHFNFLDLDYREAHIQAILRRSHRGIYRARLENPQPLVFNIWEDGEALPVGRVTLETTFPHVMQSRIFFNEETGLWTVTGPDNETAETGGTDSPLQSANHQVTVTLGDRDMSFHRFDQSRIALEWYGLESFDQLLFGSYTFLANGDAELFGHFDSHAAIAMMTMKMALNQDAILAEYADFVYANYLALPDTLPQRVIDLAHDITRYYYTDYDKIRAIQEYLIQFPYTLSPNPVPVDRDFVDYFLFDGQEGYCVYYASAMTVMARAIGIPARYAEGFLLPAHRDEETGLFNVTNRNAHAWSEVYFEGFGWLIVESTAPYVFAMYERPLVAGQNIFTRDFIDHWQHEEYLRMMGIWDMMGMGSGQPWQFDGTPIPTTGAIPGEGTASQQTPPDLWMVALAFAISIPTLIVLYLAFWNIIWVIRRFKVKRMDTRGQAVYYYRAILKITDFWRYPLLAGETAHTYAQRIRYRFPFVSDTVFIQDLNEIYYRARYAKKPLTIEEANYMKDRYYELVDYVRIVRGKHRFMIIKYIKGIFVL